MRPGDEVIVDWHLGTVPRARPAHVIERPRR
jgi:hypothetical protein